jgi:GTP-binding protein
MSTVPVPLVALVGRPNVGKSTLFNRLVGERLAIVEDLPGTTRDRLYARGDWTGREFDVVDTGGLAFEEDGALLTRVRNQAEVAIEEADVIVFLTDGSAGISPDDYEVAQLLRRSGKPVVLVVNKTESEARRLEAPEFWNLGLGEPYPISALHGMGTGDALDAVVGALPQAVPEERDERLHVAILGRPNVGKSSLLNKLTGQERVIVSEVAGTTRDAIDTPLTFEDEEIVLVDTAGIRRRGKVEPGIERYSVLRAIRALERADVAVLVLDAVDGVTAQDAHIAGMIHDAGKGTILAVNKWDLVEKDSRTADVFARRVRDELKFMDYAPILFVSALTGQRVTRLLTEAVAIDEARRQRVPTAELNRLVADLQARHNPPSRQGRQLKVYYATQAGVAPPTFVFFVNDRRLVHFSYARFVENQLRRAYPFPGTPVRLVFRSRGEEEGPRRV